jgi:hypothetical protein
MIGQHQSAIMVRTELLGMADEVQMRHETVPIRWWDGIVPVFRPARRLCKAQDTAWWDETVPFFW